MQKKIESKPEYFVQIPAKVVFESKLPPGAKLLYGDILFLNHAYGFCSQKNAYFAANYNVSIRTIENWIHKLKALRLIKVELIRNQNKEVELRKIFALVKIETSKDLPGEQNVKGCATSEKAANQFTKTNSSPKKIYGSNQNVFLTENEAAEIFNKITREQFDQAVEIYGEWKIKSGANPRSDFISIDWAVNQVVNPIKKNNARMSAVQSSRCDVVTDEMLRNIPF